MLDISSKRLVLSYASEKVISFPQPDYFIHKMSELHKGVFEDKLYYLFLTCYLHYDSELSWRSCESCGVNFHWAAQSNSESYCISICVDIVVIKIFERKTQVLLNFSWLDWLNIVCSLHSSPCLVQSTPWDKHFSQSCFDRHQAARRMQQVVTKTPRDRKVARTRKRSSVLGLRWECVVR